VVKAVTKGLLTLTHAPRRPRHQTPNVFQVRLFGACKKRLLDFEVGVDAHQRLVRLQGQDQQQAAEIWHCHYPSLATDIIVPESPGHHIIR
jgi:hypothetical protein